MRIISEIVFTLLEKILSQNTSYYNNCVYFLHNRFFFSVNSHTLLK